MVCFQLYPIGGDKPATLNSVDEAICSHLSVSVDPIKYCENWFNTIGLMLACGRSFDDIVKHYNDAIIEDPNDTPYCERMLNITRFLQSQYTTNSFYSRREFID